MGRWRKPLYPERLRSCRGVELLGFDHRATNADWSSSRLHFLYAFHCPGFYKVGQSSSWENRLSVLQAGMPYDLTLVGFVAVPRLGADYAEAWALSRMGEPVRGEWYRDSSHTKSEVRKILNAARSRGLAFVRHLREDEAGRRSAA